LLLTEENWRTTVNISRIEACEMRFVRTVAGLTLRDQNTSEDFQRAYTLMALHMKFGLLK